MEWQHATGVEDRETSPEEDRVVRDGDERVVGPEEEVNRTLCRHVERPVEPKEIRD